jgi:hypothetical protein
MFLRLPRAGAWFNALGLAIAMALLSTGVSYISRNAQFFELLPVQLDLIIVCMFALSPIWGIAYIHHLINVLLEKFVPESERQERDRLTGGIPTIISWWEGMYAWLTINIATVGCIAIGGLFIPTNNRYYNIWSFIYHIGEMLTDVNKFKYILSGPFILWIILAAYLYEFETAIQRYFVQRVREENR